MANRRQDLSTYMDEELAHLQDLLRRKENGDDTTEEMAH